jgi:uncharacterized protein (TIGR00369 family)
VTDRRLQISGCTSIGEPPAPGRLAGLEFIEQMRSGTIPYPPIAVTLGWTIVAAGPGTVTQRLSIGEHLLHGARIVHGGVIATLLDSCLANSVLSTLEAGRGCVTTQLSVNFIRAVKETTGWIEAVGGVLHTGRTTAVAEATIVDDKGRLCAKGTSSFSIFDVESTARSR